MKMPKQRDTSAEKHLSENLRFNILSYSAAKLMVLLSLEQCP